MLVQVFDKEISSHVKHREGVEDAVADFKIVCMNLFDIATIQVYGMAQLVVVHAVVGIERHTIGRFAQFWVGMRYAIAKRVRHLGVVVFEQHRAAMLKALGKVVFGRDGGQDCELVATQAKHRLVNFDIELKVQAHLHNVAVTLVVTEGVVAVLEVIDIDKRHGDRRALFPELFQRAGKAAAVAKAGKLVGKGCSYQVFRALEQVLNDLFERLCIGVGCVHM